MRHASRDPQYVPKHLAAPDAPASESADAPADDASIGRSAAMMSGLVVISRITGFMRTWGQAFALGTTMTASCYTIANNLPNQLYELVMGGMLVTAFLPVYMSVKRRAGREGASAYASNLLSIVVLLMGVLAMLAFVFARQVIWTQSFSATDQFDADLSIYFFRFFAISIVLYALSSIISGVLNAERDFLWSTAAPIFNNIITSSSFFIYATLAGANPSAALLVLALGSPLGVLTQVLVQIPALRRQGIRISFRIDLRDPAIRETLAIGAPTLIVTLENFLTVSVMNSSALSVVPNGASIMYYARLWYVLPYSILAIPITTAMFTELSDRAAAGDLEGFAQGVRGGLGKITFMLIPFAMYLIVFAPALVAVLGSSRFDPADVALTVSYLSTLALALPLFAVNTFLQKACSALRRMGSFVAANVAGGIAQVAFCLILTPHLGFIAVALSEVLFFAVVDVITLAFLRRALGPIGLGSLAVSAMRALGLGAAGAATGWLILQALVSLTGPLTGAIKGIAYCAAGGIPALLVTFGAGVALKLPEASFARSIVARFTR